MKKRSLARYGPRRINEGKMMKQMKLPTEFSVDLNPRTELLLAFFDSNFVLFWIFVSSAS